MTPPDHWGRYALLAGGGLLALQGFRRGGWAGAALTAAGAGLLASGVANEAVREKLHLPDLRELPRAVSKPVTIHHTVTINKPREELYKFWRDFGNLSRIMPEIDRIDTRDQRHSHWVVTGPGGAKVRFDAEVTDESENQRIAWRSVGDADVKNSGKVTFNDAPGDRGTEVRLELTYDAPFGKLGQGVAMLTGQEPQLQAHRALRRLKQLMEAGEITTNRMRSPAA
ncbi:SRPBCC family protein [Skermanella stibiiresistens]|nr:SRPBCC family protein [Skermanella stibiiresistens]